MKIGPKAPAETKRVTFDFNNQLGSANIVSAVVQVQVLKGVDATPLSRLVGPPTIAAKSVTQKVSGGVLLGRYEFVCLATDDGGLVHEVVAVMDIARL